MNKRLNKIEELVNDSAIDAIHQASILNLLIGKISQTRIEEPLSYRDRETLEALANSAERFTNSVKERMNEAEQLLMDFRHSLEAQS